MLTHKGCGGRFAQWQIPEHNYCFMRCEKCQKVLGGERVQEKINRLMGIKVRPTMRRS